MNRPAATRKFGEKREAIVLGESTVSDMAQELSSFTFQSAHFALLAVALQNGE